MTTVIHRVPGLVLTDHTFRVPLDHAQPEGEQIEVFAREVVAAAREAAQLPWLVFFQGGPGFASPRPLDNKGWLKRALQNYRVLLLDQRGTGRSTPLTFQTLAHFTTPQAMAAYLKCFRTDAIVQDAEWIRREWLDESEPWSVLGQSFGGFCVTHYLSAAPAGLKEAIITGGLPPLDRPVDDIYQATYQRVIARNRLYYQRYPDDVERVQAVVRYLSTHKVHLPTGDRLSLRRFQQLGMAFGESDGYEQIHYLLEEAFVAGSGGQELSYTFLRGLENRQPFDTNPLYALLHEAIYCQQEASCWSAERVRANYPEFELSPDRPVYFTGEMIYPWMFDEYERLRPLKEAAEILAHDEAWPRLYDPAVLRTNTVPGAAAIYYNDMYVERQFSEETAQNIQGIKVWVTNEYEHNGLRAEGEIILGRLLGMLHGEI
ncbi:MAG: alpha/beta fold hydrolase [Chloroflexi bacterium]|nr:alpha/beta fold hydrolase [Chloroflexota bacterium]